MNVGENRRQLVENRELAFVCHARILRGDEKSLSGDKIENEAHESGIRIAKEFTARYEARVGYVVQSFGFAPSSFGFVFFDAAKVN